MLGLQSPSMKHQMDTTCKQNLTKQNLMLYIIFGYILPMHFTEIIFISSYNQTGTNKKSATMDIRFFTNGPGPMAGARNLPPWICLFAFSLMFLIQELGQEIHL